MIAEGGEERLVPHWMFEPHAFDPSPVALPLVSLDALRDLLRIVFSSGLRGFVTVTMSVSNHRSVDGTQAAVAAVFHTLNDSARSSL